MLGEGGGGGWAAFCNLMMPGLDPSILRSARRKGL